MIAYLMAHKGLSYTEAKEYVSMKRDRVKLVSGFKSQLKSFEQLIATYGPDVPTDVVTTDTMDGLDSGSGFRIFNRPESSVVTSTISQGQRGPIPWPLFDWILIAVCFVSVIAAFLANFRRPSSIVESNSAVLDTDCSALP